MSIITNLIHAALFFVVGVLVYTRQDVVWMLYMYHTTLFWMIIAMCSTLLVILYNHNHSIQSYIQTTTIILFGVCSMIVWYRYRPSYQRTLQTAAAVWNTNPPTSTKSIRVAIRIIYYASQWLQYGMMIYYIVTTLQYIHDHPTNDVLLLCSKHNDNHDDHDHEHRFLHDISNHNDAIMSMSTTTSTSMTLDAHTTSRPSGTTSHMDIMNDFVMSYSEVAHLTFVLSLLQLSMIYPHSATCCMGSIIVAGWKLLLNTISLSNVLSTATVWTIRTRYSLIYTLYDILLMIPILWSALYLYFYDSNPPRHSPTKGTLRRRREDDTTTTTSCTTHNSGSSSHDGSILYEEDEDAAFVTLGVVPKHPNEDEVMDIHTNRSTRNMPYYSIEEGMTKVDHERLSSSNDIHDDGDDPSDISTFECRTTFQIASSSSSSSSSFTTSSSLYTKQSHPQQPHHQYSSRQQYGAKFLSYGSLVLWIGMTLESMVLQSQSLLFINHAKYDLYKWGLHLCVMFTFTTVMCMNVGDMSYYERYSRPILLLACPAGSLIAMYQSYNLWNNTSHMDVMSSIVFILFIVRCICGIIQTMGVYLLNTVRPQQQQQPHQYCATTVSLSSSNSHDDNDDDDDSSTSHGSDDEQHHIIDIDNDATTVVSFIDNHHPSSTVQQRKQAHQHRLQTVHARIHILFYYLFIPIMIVFIAMSLGQRLQMIK